MTWNSQNVRQSAAARGGVPDVLFQMPGTVGFPKSRNQCRKAQWWCSGRCSRSKFNTIFWNKDLYELFECYVHIHSLILPEDLESGIQFYAEVLIFLQNDGSIV